MQKKITQKLLDHIKTHPFDYGDTPAASVLDFLYLAYCEIDRGDSEEIKQGFAEIDPYFEEKSFDEVQRLFSCICKLCNAYEKRAFTEGLQLGAELVLELQKD